MEKERTKKTRYHFIDSYRGFVILHMILYHFCYDVFVLQGINPEWIDKPAAFVWQQFICISFIVIAGISAGFSRNLLKRGLLLNGIGFLITLVTLVFIPEASIYFGILNLMGCALLLLIPLRRFIDEKNWRWWGIGSLFLFLVFRHIQSGYIGIGRWRWVKIPDIFYESGLLTPLGMPDANFLSADYFPIFPWFFLFVFGYCISYLIRKRSLEKIMSFSVPGLREMGQKSLIIYLIHQPLAWMLSELLF